MMRYLCLRLYTNMTDTDFLLPHVYKMCGELKWYCQKDGLTPHIYNTTYTERSYSSIHDIVYTTTIYRLNGTTQNPQIFIHHAHKRTQKCTHTFK